MSDNIDVKTWLMINKLSYVEKQFIERGITVEELMTLDTQELKDFAKELGLVKL